jgi:hypothetical protein
MIKSRRIMDSGCSTNGEMNSYRILVGKPEGKRPLGRLRCKVVNNIKIDFRDIGWVVWIELIWLRIGTSEGYCERGNELMVS